MASKPKPISVGAVYKRVMRLHNSVPFRFFSGGGAFPAWHYFFEVTRRCNLRCRMCQYREWFGKQNPADLISQELTAEEWKGLVDQTGPLSLITFTGGEPWVRQDFLDILSYASGKRRTHVITNGLLMTDERADACLELAPRRFGGKGFCFLGASIDGDQETHDAIRGREGAFEELTARLKRLTRLRNEAGKHCPYVHVTAVIQEGNLHCLPRLPALLADAGASVLNLTMEQHIAEIENVGKVDPETLCESAVDLPNINPLRLERVLKETAEAAEAVGIELRLPDMPMSQILKYHNGGMDLNDFTCRGPWTNLYVGASGGVYPCFLKELGNVRESSLRGLWNGVEMRGFRKRLRDGVFCVCQGCCHLEHQGSGASCAHHRPQASA